MSKLTWPAARIRCCNVQDAVDAFVGNLTNVTILHSGTLAPASNPLHQQDWDCPPDWVAGAMPTARTAAAQVISGVEAEPGGQAISRTMNDVFLFYAPPPATDPGLIGPPPWSSSPWGGAACPWSDNASQCLDLPASFGNSSLINWEVNTFCTHIYTIACDDRPCNSTSMHASARTTSEGCVRC